MILADTSAWVEFLRRTGSTADERIDDLLGEQGARRAAGQTIRALTDCLIAAVAIRTGNAILHTDSDFDALARHAPLQLA